MRCLLILILVINFCVPFIIGKICQAEICKSTAKELETMMDKTVDPCDDFSTFMCGNMDKLFSIPPGGTSYDVTVELETKITNEVKSLLESQPLTNHSLPQTKTALFYKSCNHMDSRNKESSKFILHFIKDLKIKKSYEKSLIYLLSSGISSRMISMFSDQDPTNPKYQILNIAKPSLVLSEGTLQSHDSGVGKEQISSYLKFMNKVLDILGIWKDDRKYIDGIMELHIKLAKAFPSIEDQSDPVKTTNKLTIRELQNKFKELSWMTLINGILKGSDKKLSENDTVLVFSLEYLDKLNAILKEYKSDPVKQKILEMDLMWGGISGLVHLGSEALIEAHNNFQNEIMGSSGRGELWKECFKITSTTLVELVGSMYVRKKFHPSQKKAIESMIENIKRSLKKVIEGTIWMDTNTKNEAYLKLKTLTSKIGYADKLLSDEYLIKKYSSLKIVENQFLQNYINYEKLLYVDLLQNVGERNPEDNWILGPQEDNAYYNPFSNEIVFPAANLRYPYYDIDLPTTYNYGGLGSTVGHEILHGFDTSGSQFDYTGLLRDWWSKSSKDEYNKRAQCIINQYAKYSIYNVSLPSSQTVGEDIADNAGMRMAYLAATTEDNSTEKLLLPGLNFTFEQLFFVGYARGWCTIVTKNAILEKMKGDVHTVWMYRINGPVSNMPEFSKAFNCDRSKNLNRPQKCILW